MSDTVREPAAEPLPDPIIIFGVGGALLLFGIVYMFAAITISEGFSSIRSTAGLGLSLAECAALLLGVGLVWQFTAKLAVRWLRANPVGLVLAGVIGVALPVYLIHQFINRNLFDIVLAHDPRVVETIAFLAFLIVPMAVPGTYLLVRGVPPLPSYLRRAIANRKKFNLRDVGRGFRGLGEFLILLITIPAAVLGGSNSRAGFRVTRLGAKAGDADSQCELGRAYLVGDRVPQDDVEAAQWMLRAAEQGHIEARRYLGYMYCFGRGLPRDEVAGARWARLAAEGGDSDAQLLLAACYSDGRGVALDEAQAFMWLRKAADQRNAQAHRMLGDFYERGCGVAQDRAEAERWYLSAIDLGDREAQQDLDKMRSTPETHDGRGGTVAAVHKSPPRAPLLPATERTDRANEQAFASLDSLIGLDSVKRNVRSLAELVKLRQWRQGASLPPLPKMSLHIVFTGNPGTGKTTVARAYAEICREIGVLSRGHLVEVDRSRIVSQYANATAKHAAEVIESALGGVLFIDEAYDLIRPNHSGWDAGPEAVAVLLKAMEDHRDDLIVIVAGYTEPMERFLNSNVGLKSRFSNFIDFPDYSVGELCQVMDRMLASSEFVLTSDARRELQRVIVEKYAARDANTWGNAREIEGLLGSLTKAQARRLTQKSTRQELQKIELIDVIAAFSQKVE